MRFKAHAYQDRAIEFVKAHKRCCLFLDMGLGKSVITLTALRDLMEDCDVKRCLVVAPKKVAESTWSSEAQKWDHLSGITVAKCIGSEKQRIAALDEQADVTVIGRDSFVWLLGQVGKRWPFDCVVLDELTSFKSSTSLRFKAMRKVSPFCRRVVGLTGTPAPNGYLDLWAQIYCVDMGQRLGRSKTRYRDANFDCVRLPNGIVIKPTLKRGAEERIKAAIADICLTMQAKDYLNLPDMIVTDCKVQLDDKARKAYKQFERDQVLQFAEQSKGERREIVAASAAALMNKLSQFANGAVYDENHAAQIMHDDKLDALEELSEAAGENGMLIFYQYRHDAERIIERIGAEMYDGDEQLRAWNEGKIKRLLAHPASTAYGLNMQSGGNYIVWFGTGWNLELYQQANARLHRQGQTKPVHVCRLIASGTVDERAAAAIDRKNTDQAALLNSLADMINEHKG